MSGNREFVFEDFFNRSNGKSVFHANAVLAQFSYKVQELANKQEERTSRLPGLSLDSARDDLRDGKLAEPKAGACLRPELRAERLTEGSRLTSPRRMGEMVNFCPHSVILFRFFPSAIRKHIEI
jgi:hypothetical protein